MPTSENNKIIWIASYPRSGNTWLRSILSSIFLGKKGKFNFSLLENIEAFDIPSRYEFVKYLYNSDYKKLKNINVISKYWLEAQRRIYKNDNYNFLKNITFFKTHSANINLNNKQFTNSDKSAGLIYIVRDPRDVVISYSKHYEVPIDKTIDNIANTMKLLRTTEKEYPILIGSLNYHYKSWKYLKAPKLIVKYENLLNDPSKTISEILLYFQIFFNYNFNNREEILKNIVKTTDFKIMQNFEKQYGFKEAAYSTQNKKFKEFFFRRGTSKQWEEILTASQINIIESSCCDLMKEFNYI